MSFQGEKSPPGERERGLATKEKRELLPGWKGKGKDAQGEKEIPSSLIRTESPGLGKKERNRKQSIKKRGPREKEKKKIREWKSEHNQTGRWWRGERPGARKNAAFAPRGSKGKKECAPEAGWRRQVKGRR